RPRADVGHDQRLLQALPGRAVELALEQGGLDLGAQCLACLGEVLAQAAEEAAAPLWLLEFGPTHPGDGGAVAGDEDVRPVAGHRRCATIAECRSSSGPRIR